MGCASSVDTAATQPKPVADHAGVLTVETMDASGSPTSRANGVKASRIATNSLAPSFTTGHRPTLASTTVGASELSTDDVGGHMRDLPELDHPAAARKDSADQFASNGAGQMRALASEPSASELQTRLAEGSTLSAVVHAAEAHTRSNDAGSGTLSVVVSADQLAGSNSQSSHGKSGLSIQTNLPQQNEIHTRFRSTSDMSQQSDDEHLTGPPEKSRDADDHSPVVFAQQRYRASLPNYSEDPQAEQRMKEYQSKFGKKNSTMEYVEQVRRQQGIQQDFIRKKKTGTIDRVQNVVFLPRGGTYVQTAVGPIQFGIPPETIKDSMTMGLVLPSHYVLPKERFSLQTGINVAEFEFPAYFNFFVLRKKVNLICNREVEPLIRTIFQETLLGPKQIDFPTHYSEACPQESYPDLAAESKHFRRNPFDPSTELSIDTLLQFTYFENGVATLTNGTSTVRIHDRGEEYTIMDDTREVATVSSYVILTPPDLNSFFTPPKPLPGSPADRAQQAAAELAEALRKENEISMPPPAESKDGDFEFDDGDQPQYHKPFIPPAFGVTMLGNSHGFDAHGTTTGFVLWMNRRGIMVDPPPYSGAILKQHGIPSRLIQGIILTHCHADHDAGTFQKILEEGKVMLHTTSIIKESFLRKYSAISGLDKEFLQKLFEFREVPIGERIHVYGGSLQFFYSLHSIPCVGFSAFCNGKSMVYSADTFNDPEGIERMHQAGVMSEGRRDQLLNFPWHHSLILHEAGVPPIHTPLKTLMALPAEVKERLYVVHVAGKDIPPDSGLKTAKVGPDNTLVIHNEMGQGFKALELLDLVGNIDLFQDFPLDRSVEVVQFGQWASYHQGETIIKQDTYGDKLYVIAMGVVSVSVNGKLVKYLTVGDHFGEMSIVTHQPRTATIVARSNCELIEFRGHEFMHLVRDTNAIERLRHLGLMQKVTSWQVISANSVLGKLSSTQKTYLQSILHKRTATRGEILWDQGEKAKIAVLVDEGLFVFARAKNMTPFARGAFVGDMQALLYGKPLTTTLVCAKDGTFYYITKKSLLKFFDDNPGVLIYFKDRRFVE